MSRRSACTLRRAARRATVLAIVLAGGGCERAAGPPAVGTASPQDVPPPQIPVAVYFTRNETPVGVTRRVPADAPLEGALHALLAGPSAEEREAGIASWFSDETAGMLRSVAVDDAGLASIDFADFSGLIPGASSSAGSALLLAELDHTVFQFPQVAAVEYRFEGSCEAFWNWIQRACAVVRRDQLTRY